MKSKPMAGFLVVISVAVISWSLLTLVGPAFSGGREAFFEWRAANAGIFYATWGAVVVVLSIPALVFVGRRLDRFETERDQSLSSARGVGRLAAKALHGDKKAIEKLEDLLDSQEPAVRYQSARALSLLADNDATETLLRKVRYWPAPDKLALIDVLKRTQDLRCVPLMRQLGADRNPLIAQKARTAMPSVMARAASLDELETQARKRSAAQARRNVGAREREARRTQTKRRPTGEGAATPTVAGDVAPTGEATAKGEATATEVDPLE